MPYTVEIARALVETLRTFVTLNRHQFAGNVANIEFWYDETRHCLSVIDGYRARIEAIKEAQGRYAAVHQTVTYRNGDGGYENDERYRSVPPARANLSDQELKELRKSVVDAAYAFALRAFREKRIAEREFGTLVERIGTSIDPADRR